MALAQGTNETMLTNNLPGTKKITNLKNQEPKPSQEFGKMKNQEPKPDPGTEQGLFLVLGFTSKFLSTPGIKARKLLDGSTLLTNN